MAAFTWDSRGAKPEGGFEPLPPGPYDLQIIEAVPDTTKNNYPCVVTAFKVIDSMSHDGKMIKFHYVTFLPEGMPGRGFASMFLKAIGEPYEEMERLQVNPSRWIGKKLRAIVDIEEYQKKSGGYAKKNVIKSVEQYAGFSEQAEHPTKTVSKQTKATEEEVPF